jgi:protein TonB
MACHLSSAARTSHDGIMLYYNIPEQSPGRLQPAPVTGTPMVRPPLRNPTSRPCPARFTAWATSLVTHGALLAAAVLLARTAPLQLIAEDQPVTMTFEAANMSAAASAPTSHEAIVDEATPPMSGPSVEAIPTPEPPPEPEQHQANGEPSGASMQPAELPTTPMPPADMIAAKADPPDPQPAEPQPSDLPSSPQQPAESARPIIKPLPSRPKPIGPQSPPSRPTHPQMAQASAARQPLPGPPSSLANLSAGQQTPASESRSIAVDGTWMQAVGAWLAAHKTYPDAARRQGEEGRLAVRFTVERTGQVSAVELVRGSGSTILDEATRDLLRRAVLPPLPPDMTQGSVTVTVQIRYALTQ